MRRPWDLIRAIYRRLSTDRPTDRLHRARKHIENAEAALATARRSMMIANQLLDGHDPSPSSLDSVYGGLRRIE